jgi:hypothetical protein
MDAIVPAWAELVSESNMPIQTAASYPFRSIGQAAFRDGIHRAVQTPHADVDSGFKACCPQKKRTTLRKSVIQSSALDPNQESPTNLPTKRSLLTL